MNNEKWIKMMNMGKKLGCHQKPERSFFVNGYQMPVCARCTGVIISTILATIIFLKKKLPISVCLSMSSVMLIDWGIQYLKIKESTNARRLVTGLIGGFGYTMLHLHFISFLVKNITNFVINRNV